MSSSYVLINVEPGSESYVFEKLSKLDFISDMNHLFGDYDIIVKIEAEGIGIIAGLVVSSIRPIDGIFNTKTLACAEF
ncbi:MAG: Lrp/AsnC family transcriptional regulator [Euryarchaeota archaeon]|jgi:DNA-binding Lrp family transcriptional regulator|nr:Lrp/AsnC family transcriptional regulator [Euryarchaeota archaeon]MBT5614180.1 Lrp/AsnC family transcriptional regulator [Euryarchaeota archaeon]MBT6683744.1 Lrp/AsnC family transcriptional regulator [Euryarchaeota archaeon]MBT6873794.1 Lrp/AsnC family transcriptional regulator [Euryarchaeota archaeon]MBT7413769.1 Lrp/AsnC family transcriptional regulator [Euryarchaeota archaeon]